MKPPSQRQLRVGELVRHALSDLLIRGDLHDPEIDGTRVTVPEVRMSPDLKIATAYVIPLGGGDGQKLVKALARNAKHLRSHVARQVNLKFAPDLRFRYDETFDEFGKIDALLRDPKVSRDLDRASEETGDTSDS